MKRLFGLLPPILFCVFTLALIFLPSQREHDAQQRAQNAAQQIEEYNRNANTRGLVWLCTHGMDGLRARFGLGLPSDEEVAGCVFRRLNGDPE